MNNLNNQYFDFIPSVSALALDDDGNGINWYHDIQIGSGNPPSDSSGDSVNSTPFVNWYLPDANEDHVLLTDGNVAFMLLEVFSETLSVGAEESSEIRLEKNPIQDRLGILTTTGLSNAELDIYDMSGRQVLSKDLGQTGERISVDINLNSGIYIVELRSDLGKFVTKIVID